MNGTFPGSSAVGDELPARRRVRHVVAAAVLAGLAALGASPASAVAPPLSSPVIVAHLDIAAGQQPENITVLPGGSPVVTFPIPRQVARIDRGGGVQVLATLPAPPAGTGAPVIGLPVVTGIVQAGGTFYVNYAAGSADLTGVWALRPGGTPHRIAALPPGGFPNGLALDSWHGYLYAADSVLGTVWRIPLAGGDATAWATGPALAPAGFLGVNGIKVNHGAVWATNTDQGTVVRIPVTSGGAAGPIGTVAAGLAGLDDFAFTGRGDTLLAALNMPNEVALVRADGTHTIVLTGEDGLQNPTAVAVLGSTVLVTNGAFFTETDPNLLRARLER